MGKVRCERRLLNEPAFDCLHNNRLVVYRQAATWCLLLLLFSREEFVQWQLAAGRARNGRIWRDIRWDDEGGDMVDGGAARGWRQC